MFPGTRARKYVEIARVLGTYDTLHYNNFIMSLARKREIAIFLLPT